jgi:hypothetical protein
MTGESITHFRDKTPGMHSEEIRAKLKKAVERWGRYITVVDLHGPDVGLGGPEEVIGHIEDAIREGDTPNLVQIDWLGAMVDKNIATRGLDTKEYIHIAPTFMRNIKAYCDSRKIRLVVYHQLSTQAQAKSSEYKPQPSDAYNFKSFHYYTDVMLQIGKLSTKTNIGHLIAGKNRRGGKPEQLVLLQGEFQRFVNASGDYVLDHKGDFVTTGDNAPDVHKDSRNKVGGAYNANQYTSL